VLRMQLFKQRNKYIQRSSIKAAKLATRYAQQTILIRALRALQSAP
jgi:hypothetical protein